VRAILLILAAFALTWLSPVGLLLIAPIVLGVPHVVSDFRYLVFRPLRLGAAPLAWTLLLAPLAAFAALRVGVYLGRPAQPRLEVVLGCSSAVLAVLLAPRASFARQGLALVALGALVLAAFRWPWQVLLLFGHVHNLVAFGLWFVWAGTPRRAALVYVACFLVLLLGLPAFSTASMAGLDMRSLTGSYAPGLSDALASRVVMSYAFAQMVHYVVWIDLVPATQRGRGLAADLGRLGLLAAAMGTVFFLGWGAFDPAKARATYLSLALFHGWLEVAVIAHLWVGRGSIALPGAVPVARPVPLVA
jgi:hypothetical protein